MAKRYTATEKWSRPWFRKLPWRYKLFWTYLLDECDIAGVWAVDFEMASLKIGAKITPADALMYLEKQIIFLNDDRWFILDYPKFQYGSLDSKNMFHRSVIKVLEKHSVPGKFWQGLARPSAGPAQGLSTKNKEQRTKEPSSKVTGNLFGEEEKRRPPPFIRPTLADVKAYCAERKNTVDPLAWMAYYESNGWRVGRNPMRNWKAAVVTWEKKNGFSNGNGHHLDPDSKEARGANYVPSAEETKKMLREMRTA